jgi:hypothetical protein
MKPPPLATGVEIKPGIIVKEKGGLPVDEGDHDRFSH